MAESIWDETFAKEEFRNIHEFAAKAVDNIIIKAFKRKSFDNVTVVMVAFKNLENAVES